MRGFFVTGTDTGVGKTFVTSAIAERLRVEHPYREHRTAGKLEVASRLSSRATVTAGARVEIGAPTARLSKSVSVQLALKTVE